MVWLNWDYCWVFRRGVLLCWLWFVGCFGLIVVLGILLLVCGVAVSLFVLSVLLLVVSCCGFFYWRFLFFVGAWLVLFFMLFWFGLLVWLLCLMFIDLVGCFTVGCLCWWFGLWFSFVLMICLLIVFCWLRVCLVGLFDCVCYFIFVCFGFVVIIVIVC